MCRRPPSRGRRRGVILLLVGVASAYVIYETILTVRVLSHGLPEELAAIRDVGRIVSPEGEMLTFDGGKGALLVPVPLYPSSQVQGASFPPTGRGDEVGLFLMLGTSESPVVVRDYYLEAWQEYGVTDRGAADRGGEPDGFDLATRPINGRVAAVEICIFRPNPATHSD